MISGLRLSADAAPKEKPAKRQEQEFKAATALC